MNAPTKSIRPWRIIAVVVVLLLAVTVWLAGLPLYQRHVAIREIERMGGKSNTNLSPQSGWWTRELMRG